MSMYQRHCWRSMPQEVAHCGKGYAAYNGPGGEVMEVETRQA